MEIFILKWFAIPFSGGPHSLKPFHHDPPVLGGPTWHGLVSLSPTCTTAPWGPGLGAPSHCSCPASLMGPARVGRGFLILAKMTVPPPPPPSLQPSRRFNPSFSCFSGCLTSSVLSLTSCPRLLFLHQGGDGNGTQGLRLPLSAGFQGVGVQEGLAHGWGVYF